MICLAHVLNIEVHISIKMVRFPPACMKKIDKTDLGAHFNASREFKRHGQRNLPIKGALYNNAHTDVS